MGAVVGLASPDDDAALRALLRAAPMDGWVRLTFPREPSYFAATALEGTRHGTVLVRAHRDGPVVAMGARAVKEVWLDRRPALLGYLGMLRFAPGWRAGRRTLARGYAAARALRADDELSFDLTAIVADNAPARRLLERGLPGMPRYAPLDELVTVVAPTGGRGARRRSGSHRTCGLRVEDAGDDALLEAFAERLERERDVVRLAPRWTRRALGELASGRLGPWRPLVAVEGGEVCGCAAVWDQRPLRQCRVAGYGPPVGRLRPAVNALLRLTGRRALPAPGADLRLGYLSHVAADDRETLEALVEVALTRAAGLGLEHLALAIPAGSPGRHEPASLVRRLPGHTYRSILYAVHDPGFDLGAVGLEGGDLRVEVATL